MRRPGSGSARSVDYRAHMQPRVEPAGVFALALLSVVWAWWATKEGAYFGVVLLPGTILLCLGTALLAGFAPWRAKLSHSRPVALALAALAALGAWSLLSALWSPAPNVAIEDGQRILVYALAFGLGIWLCNLLGPRMELATVPVVAAAAFAGLATIVSLAGGDTPRDLFESDGTLDYPLGYRNANAAFFAIALFPAVGLAARRELDWRARGIALATATLCVDLMLFSQSRASVPALVLALLVFVLLFPNRVRALAWLALAAVPAIAFLPAILNVYETANDVGVAGTVAEMHAAGIVLSVIVLAAFALAAMAARFESRLPALSEKTERGNRLVARGLIATAAIGAVGFLAVVGDPIDWVGDKAQEFRSAGTPEAAGSSRFSFNAGSNRYDMWRVALDNFGEDPLFGDGAGGYQYTYLVKRDSIANAHDAHSVELELLAELGLPGFALFACFVGGAALGTLRARRLGPSAATIGAVALASGTYWLVHTSLDWFWPYPAVTAPTMALLGAACGPAVLTIGARLRVWWRPWLVVGLGVLALSAVPLWLSDRYVDNASKVWPQDLDRAYGDLARAQDLNPLSDWPILVEGEIAKEAGDTDRAIAAFTRAVTKRPEEYAGYYRLAELRVDRNPTLARNEVRVALELNPLDANVRRLAQRLGLDPDAEIATADE
jgi:tetratricopeptide (TPR) repeat protein